MSGITARSSSPSTLIVTGGWRTAQPRFLHLSRDAVALVYGGSANEQEIRDLERELISFLKPIEGDESTHTWLMAFQRDVFSRWKQRARTITEKWDDVDEMVRRTDPNGKGVDLTLAVFSGDTSGSGALNFSTFHSSKGREFRAVILLGMDNDVIPNKYSARDPKKLREERREFYVAVTRAKEQLHIVFTKGQHSSFVVELYKRSTQ